jgi:hypothetical protein
MGSPWDGIAVDAITYHISCYYCQITERQTWDGPFLVGCSILPWPRVAEGWRSINGRAVCPKHTRFEFTEEHMMPVDLSVGPDAVYPEGL